MTYDVVIIGGGVNGSGIARDCAMRGLKVALLERKDFSGGTTGASSGLIHGGARYLLFDVPTAKTSCLDSGFIRKITPHLLFRVPMLIPVFADDPHGMARIETVLACYDEFQPLKNGKTHTRLTTAEALQLEPGLNPEIVGAVTFDEWGIDPFRLVTFNALAAAEYGAVVKNHTAVTGFLRDGERVVGVETRHTLSGHRETLRAKVVVNACGPWTPKLAALAGVEVAMRPTKGVHLVFDRRLSNLGITARTIDNRDVYALPHENSTLLGCTDDDHYGDPDRLSVSADETGYLLQALSRVFPAIRQGRIVRTMAGLRPTAFAWGPRSDALSREFALHDHAGDGADGLVSLVGGKLSAYRFVSEQVADLVCAKLGRRGVCQTHQVPLPGSDRMATGRLDQSGQAPLTAAALAKRFDLPRPTAQALFYRQGSRSWQVLQDAQEAPEVCSHLCVCEPVTEAEVRHSIRREWAITVDDVRRRTRLGMGPCQGMRCTGRAGAVLAEELALSPVESRRRVLAFLQERWKGKRPVLGGSQLAQEEINQAVYRLVGGYSDRDR